MGGDTGGLFDTLLRETRDRPEPIGPGPAGRDESADIAPRDTDNDEAPGLDSPEYDHTPEAVAERPGQRDGPGTEARGAHPDRAADGARDGVAPETKAASTTATPAGKGAIADETGQQVQTVGRTGQRAARPAPSNLSPQAPASSGLRPLQGAVSGLRTAVSQPAVSLTPQRALGGQTALAAQDIVDGASGSASRQNIFDGTSGPAARQDRGTRTSGSATRQGIVDGTFGSAARQSIVDGTSGSPARQNRSVTSGSAGVVAKKAATTQTGLAGAATAVAGTPVKAFGLPAASGAAPVTTPGGQQVGTLGLATPGLIHSAATTASSGAAMARPTPSPAGAAQQVAIQLHKAAEAGQERINIRLHPAELGRIAVRLEWAEDGILRAMISAERSDTLDLLQRDSRTLGRTLQEAGIKTDAGSLSFDLHGQAEDGGTSAEPGDGRPGRSGPDSAETDAGENGGEAAPRRAPHDGVLDLSD
jgi:hypothetical protein